MSSTAVKSQPPDQRQRDRALDASRSILVQAPAGSGKTDLLTRRFLRLLGEVDDPRQIVAITFTNAAAAEMRHRILAGLEEAAASEALAPASTDGADEFSMEALARRALSRSLALGWNLVETPSQLRISTIDSFCRELALEQPLLSRLGAGIAIYEQPEDLYRRAARSTLEAIDGNHAALSSAIAALLEWRDNNWKELEDLLVDMLGVRDRWMHEFVLEREPDWDALRARLERPFANAVREHLTHISGLLDAVPGAREEALELARFACDQTGGQLHGGLAELAEFPCAPFDALEVEAAREAHHCLTNLLLTKGSEFRSRVNKTVGFPSDRKNEKNRILALIADLKRVPGLETALAAVRDLPPSRYTEDDWRIVRACFTVLRYATGELQLAFANAGAADFTEVAQIAQRVLIEEDEFPSDAALAIAEGIRHLLVDEFQDTSRLQHELLRRIVAAWPEREDRTLFAVGDPMQSIYFFRDADAELFPRVRDLGLEIRGAEPLPLDFVPLTANFRTAPALVESFNDAFEKIFAVNDGSGIPFARAIPRRETQNPGYPYALHPQFVPRASAHADPDAAARIDAARANQVSEIVDLIRAHHARLAEFRAQGEKYRIAVLARARKSLVPIAEALRAGGIPFRAVDLEGLADRPEALDALALARALLDPEDRVAWLSVLRAPWCGLALHDLHTLVSEDSYELLARPVPELLAERLHLLSDRGRAAASRVLDAANSARELRSALPNASLGTWLEQVWLRLGGADCVDKAARANLDLLWSCLDRLPAGEQDLLGAGLNAALVELKALPDPDATGDHGVQLMTIHKAKGLEFEVVIVPDLQARCGSSRTKLLSWLERGIPAEPNADSSTSLGDTTEFLIAPVQSRGDEAGKAKKWVDRMRGEREAQEDRRILYVAATRAREELHLFAQPAIKVEANGDLSLSEPINSLLKTAWPALADEVRARFEAWKAATPLRAPEPAVLHAIAASAETPQATASPVPTFLRRLPADYRPAPVAAAPSAPLAVPATGSPRLFVRHEGGLLSRVKGIALHRFMEELARLRVQMDWEPARAGLAELRPRVAAELRGAGLDVKQAGELAAGALADALNASRDPAAEWILSPHAGAASEVRWGGVVADSLQTVQVDRVFRAGPAPGSNGDDCWWIVDYKSHGVEPGLELGSDPAAALPRLREIFSPQLDAYAVVLRNLHGADVRIFAGLYYPRKLLFDWWET